MQTGILGKNEELRRLWGGLLQELVVQLNSERGPEREEQLNKLLRDEMMPIPVSRGTEGITIIKTVAVRIGGGRTTDQIVEAAKRLEGPNRPSYINSEITKKNMPSGHGRARVVLTEWFGFDHNPTTGEVQDRCVEPGYGHSTYEDGLRFQEDRPDDQRERPHVVIPENPWCNASGYPRALSLWGDVGIRGLDLCGCRPTSWWGRDDLFARRKYVFGT